MLKTDQMEIYHVSPAIGHVFAASAKQPNRGNNARKGGV
jgi:hypothetical protein